MANIVATEQKKKELLEKAMRKAAGEEGKGTEKEGGEMKRNEGRGGNKCLI